MERKARTLTYDIETSMNLGGYFGPKYDVQIAKVIQHGFVFGFAYKYLHQKRIHSCYIWDFPRYKREPRNDIEVIKKWRELMLQTDAIVGWNSDAFDNKVMMGRLIIHKLPPLHLPQSIDVMKALKRIARYDSYKLDDVSAQLGHGHKIKTDVDLWWDCAMGIKRAQREMVAYNKRDVEVTELDYLDIRPHMLSHPNIANIEGRPNACPRCGVEGFLWSQGWRITKSGRYRRWQCKNCGSFVSSRKGEPLQQKPNYV